MIDQLTDRIADLAKAAARKCAVFAVIGIVMLIGAGFLLGAVYMGLAASFGAIAAATALGGTLIALALVTLAIMLQRDPGDGIDHAVNGEEQAANTKRAEDDALFDLLIHSAMAGYATGQGNKPRMQTGFDQMVTDLNALGVFDRPSAKAKRATNHSDADTKMAG
ncbi:MAG: hypothetical protein KTR23_08135 [Rhodospirillales bacterium]|nr:hypothetical protein [Rhodospirillales bacterium]